MPLNHLRGLPRYLSSKLRYYLFSIMMAMCPPACPICKGFASGFRIYQGADLSEYTAFISNSSGGAAMLRQLGAENVHTIWYGADPEVFAPVSVPAQDY